MNKILKSSLAIAMLTGVGITSASAKMLKASDIDAISDDPIYVRGNSVFVNEITMADVLSSFDFQLELDPSLKKFDSNLYLNKGTGKWFLAAKNKSLTADEIEKLEIDMIQLIGELDGKQISTNSTIYSNEQKYGYIEQKQYGVDNTDKRYVELFLSSAEANKVVVNSDNMISSVFDSINTVFKDALTVVDTDEAEETVKYFDENGLIEIHIKNDKTNATLASTLGRVKAMLADESLKNIVLTYSEADYALDSADHVDQAITEMLTAMNGKGDLSLLDGKTFTIQFNFDEEKAKDVGKGLYTVKFIADIVKVPTNSIVEDFAKDILPADYTEALTPDANGNITVYLNEIESFDASKLQTTLEKLFTDNESIKTIKINDVTIERGKVADAIANLKALDCTLGKTLNITFELEGLAQVETGNSEKFTVTFKNIVDTDELFAKYAETHKDSTILSSNYEADTLTLTLKDPIDGVPSGTGVIDAITTALESDNYSKITVNYAVNGVSKSIEFTVDDLVKASSYTKVYLKVASLVADMLGIEDATTDNYDQNFETTILSKLRTADFGELYDKSFSISFTLKDNVDNKSTYPSYTVQFKTEVEIDKYIQKVIKKITDNKDTFGFEATLDPVTKELLFNIINDSKKFGQDIKDTDIIDTLWEVANNKRVQSVEINTQIGDAEVKTIKLDKNIMQNELTSKEAVSQAILKAVGLESAAGKGLANIQAAISIKVTLIDNENVTLASSDTENKQVVNYTLKIGKFYDAQTAISNFIDKFNQKYSSNKQYNLVLGEDNNIQLVIQPQYSNNNQLSSTENLSRYIKELLDSEIKKENLVEHITLDSGVQEYQDPSEADIRGVLYDIAQLEQRDPTKLSPANLNKKGFDLKIELVESVKFKDETDDGNYHITIVVNKVNLDSLIKGNLNRIGGEYFTATYDNSEDRIVTLSLKNVNTKIKDVHDTMLFVLLSQYDRLLSASVADTPINSKTALATILTGLTEKGEEATLEDLNDKELVITFTIGEESYDVTVKFNTSAAVVKNFDSHSDKTLGQLITSGVEKVYLSDSVSTNDLKLKENANFEIVGNGNTITGNIDISGNNANLKLTDVTLDGKINVQQSGTNATITGSKDAEGNITTVIKGGIDAEKQTGSLTLDTVKIEGTKAELTNKAVINASSGSNFILKNSEVKYIGDGNNGTTNSAIYSLMKIEGDATITGNKFDISKIKNPIEFKWTKASAEGTGKNIDITDNVFTGDNFVDDKDSHNVINIYNLKDGAEVNIKNNTFDCANSMLRISNPSDHEVTFNVVGNHVKSYGKASTGETEKALIVIRPNTKMNLNKITINHKGNTFVSEDNYYEESDENSDTRLVWINDKDHVGAVEESKLNIQPYVEPEA